MNKPADVSSEEESDGYDEDDDQLTAVDDSEYESDEGDFLLSESGQSDAQSRTARARSNQRLSTPRLSEGAMKYVAFLSILRGIPSVGDVACLLLAVE